MDAEMGCVRSHVSGCKHAIGLGEAMMLECPLKHWKQVPADFMVMFSPHTFKYLTPPPQQTCSTARGYQSCT